MEKLRVGSLNMWNRMGSWDERLVSLADELAALDLDVLGLQEVLASNPPPEPFDETGLNQARDIVQASGLKLHTTYGTARDEPFTMGNAVVSRYPLVRTLTFRLPNLESDERRCLVYTEVETPRGILPFATTHLNFRHNEGHIREAQVLALVDALDGLFNPSFLPLVLVGDFNAEPDSDEIRYLCGYTSLGRQKRTFFIDCHAQVGVLPGHTWNNQNPHAALTHEWNRRIDYVFVRGPDDRFRGQPLSSTLVFHQPGKNGVYPSDHFGVVVEISI